MFKKYLVIEILNKDLVFLVILIQLYEIKIGPVSICSLYKDLCINVSNLIYFSVYTTDYMFGISVFERFEKPIDSRNT